MTQISDTSFFQESNLGVKVNLHQGFDVKTTTYLLLNYTVHELKANLILYAPLAFISMSYTVHVNYVTYMYSVPVP